MRARVTNDMGADSVMTNEFWGVRGVAILKRGEMSREAGVWARLPQCERCLIWCGRTGFTDNLPEVYQGVNWIAHPMVQGRLHSERAAGCGAWQFAMKSWRARRATDVKASCGSTACPSRRETYLPAVKTNCKPWWWEMPPPVTFRLPSAIPAS